MFFLTFFYFNLENRKWYNIFNACISYSMLFTWKSVIQMVIHRNLHARTKPKKVYSYEMLHACVIAVLLQIGFTTPNAWTKHYHRDTADYHSVSSDTTCKSALSLPRVEETLGFFSHLQDDKYIAFLCISWPQHDAKYSCRVRIGWSDWSGELKSLWL